MNKRKQKQLRRIMAAKRTEKCGQSRLLIMIQSSQSSANH